jgi:hypothetical protein
MVILEGANEIPRAAIAYLIKPDKVPKRSRALGIGGGDLGAGPPLGCQRRQHRLGRGQHAQLR